MQDYLKEGDVKEGAPSNALKDSITDVQWKAGGKARETDTQEEDKEDDDENVVTNAETHGAGEAEENIGPDEALDGEV